MRPNMNLLPGRRVCAVYHYSSGWSHVAQAPWWRISRARRRRASKMVGEAVGRRQCVGGASLGGPYGAAAKAHCLLCRRLRSPAGEF